MYTKGSIESCVHLCNPCFTNDIGDTAECWDRNVNNHTRTSHLHLKTNVLQVVVQDIAWIVDLGILKLGGIPAPAVEGLQYQCYSWQLHNGEETLQKIPELYKTLGADTE